MSEMSRPCKVVVYERKPGVWCWMASREVDAEGSLEVFAQSPKSGYQTRNKSRDAAIMALFGKWRVEWVGDE